LLSLIVNPISFIKIRYSLATNGSNNEISSPVTSYLSYHFQLPLLISLLYFL
jgi:hypothetical protein